MKVIQPLNFINYNKKTAIDLLQKRFGWNKYKYKHYESRFTRFYEGYWLLEKFGYDKRKAHLSSLVLTDQMTREEALNELRIKPYSKEEKIEDFNYISKKLGISTEYLTELFNSTNKSFKDYKSNYYFIQLFVQIARLLKIERRLIH